jgi:hypothetical protein
MTVRAPFGSCKGVPIRDLTDRDLLWLHAMHDLRPWLREAIDVEYHRRDVPPLEIVLSKLKGVGRTSYGFMALCPAHDDRNPSLWINARPDGVVSIYCHAGCATPRVLQSLGLGFPDLYPLSMRR